MKKMNYFLISVLNTICLPLSGSAQCHSIILQRQSESGMVNRVPSICQMFHDIISAALTMAPMWGIRPQRAA